jgi:hypothetical protein
MLIEKGSMSHSHSGATVYCPEERRPKSGIAFSAGFRNALTTECKFIRTSKIERAVGAIFQPMPFTRTILTFVYNGKYIESSVNRLRSVVF